MRKVFLAGLLLAVGIAGYVWTCVPSADQAVWRVTSPEPSLILVQADFTPAERAATPSVWRWIRTVKFWWAWNHEAKWVKIFRPARERRLQERSRWAVSAHAVQRLGYWKSPVGQARFPNAAGRLGPACGSEVIYHVFLQLDRPLEDGETVDVVTPFGQNLSYVRHEDVPTPFLKVNQVGYHPDAPRRYAYLGGWLGTLGAWRPAATNLPYAVVSCETDRVMYTGVCRPRPADSTVGVEATPWTGEETYELDLSHALPEGRYFVRVPGVGRSLDFAISSAGVRTALAAHLHGLLAQRCGSPDKTPAHTDWPDAPCHLNVWRGTFPPDNKDYWGQARNPGGFTDRLGRPVQVDPFDVIERNTDWSTSPESFPGGWHDAADYDRRPHHLSIVTDLAAVYLIKKKPVGFDRLLDEAAWGLEHLRRAQTPEGGVGTWIETTRHPREGEGLPSKDPLRYAISRPTRASTLAFAAAAAELARCSPELEARFREPAQRAWAWVQRTSPATNVPFTASCAGVVLPILWHEAPNLSPRDELKVAVNLAALGETGRLDRVLSGAFLKRFDDEIRKDAWSWSPLALLDLFASDDPRLECFRKRMRTHLLFHVDRTLAAQEAQPYRLPMANGTALGWGVSHPLVAARAFVAAHAITGEDKYLSAIYLAQDYHCGCNVDGMTLTSGLGTAYPVRFLSLQSIADEVDEYVAGITPFHWCFGAGAGDLKFVHTWAEVQRWPIWRRRTILEALDVGSGEYTVFETIGPAAAVTAYLSECSKVALSDVPIPRAQGKPETLPGYWALP